MKKLSFYTKSLLLFLFLAVSNFSYAQFNTQVNAGADTSICQGGSVQLNAVLGTGNTSGCTTTPPSPTVTCTSCNSTISGNGNADVNSGQIVCVAANTSFTGNLNINGGTLVICGSINPQNVNFNSGHIVVIGTAMFNNLNMNNSSSTLKNYGTLTLQNFTFNGTFENHGIATKSNDFNINSGAVFLNTGTFTVSSNFNNNSSVTNNGTITVNGALQNNGSGNFTNNCAINANGNFFTGGVFNNNGSLSAGNYSYSWSPSAGLNNSNIKNPVASPTQTTTYTLTVNGPNGFVRTDQIVITIGNTSSPVLTNIRPLVFCQGDSVILSTALGASSYVWLKNDSVIATTTRNQLPVYDAGNYDVRIINSGCLSNPSNILTVQINPVTECGLEPSFNPGIFSLNGPKYPNDTFSLPPPMYVYDRFGDSVLLDQIKIPQHTVPAGIFRLHFIDDETNTGDGFDDIVPGPNNDIGDFRRAVIVQAFQDISFLFSATGDRSGLANPYPTLTLAQRPWIEIEIRSGAIAGNPNALAAASQYYQENGPGVTYGTIWEGITTGFDPYFNIANTPFIPPAASDAGSFYSGYVQVNFNFLYYLNLTNVAGIAVNNEFDLYSVVLHEILHAVGIASLVNDDGTSKLRPGRYSIYDTHLTLNDNTTRVITNPSNCYDGNFNVAENELISGCGSGNEIHFNGSFLTNHIIYSPSVWDGGSSLSHFNCAAGGGCPLVYSTNGYSTNFCAEQGLAWVQRTPNINEVRALCDLGYRTTGIYGNGFAQFDDGWANPRNYGIDCNNNAERVAGVNDFGPYVNNPYQANPPQYTVQIGQSLDFDNPTNNRVLRNDINAVSLSCIEIVFGGGTITAITPTGFLYTPAGNFIGQAMLKYRPVNANGIRGNITYIFINVLAPPLPAQCLSPIDGCNLVCDGAFENGVPAAFLPRNGGTFDINIFNWRSIGNTTPDYFIRNSAYQGAPGVYFGVPVNFASGTTINSTNVDNGTGIVDSHDGIPNNRYVGQHPNEAFYGRLTSVLSPGNYELSFWIRPSPTIVGANATTMARVTLNANVPPNAAPFGTTIYASPAAIPIAGSNNGWTLVAQNFTVNAGDNFQFITFEMIGGTAIYQFIDDVSITEVNSEMYQLTSTISSTQPCDGEDVIVNYQLCLNAPALTNAADITLQLNLPPNITIVAGDFNDGGQHIIPANTFSSAPDNCMNFTATFHMTNFVEDIPVSIILNNNSGPGVCIQPTNGSNVTTFTPNTGLPRVTITGTVSDSSSCPGENVTITYNVCLANNFVENPNPIILQATQDAGLQLAAGGDFDASGLLTIPAGALTTAQPCTTLVLNLNIANNAVIGVALQNTLNFTDGICNQNPPNIINQFMVINCCALTAGAGNDATICTGDSVQIGSAPVAGLTYSWSPVTGLSNSAIANPIAANSITTDYILTVSDTLSSCTARDTVRIVVECCHPYAVIPGTGVYPDSELGSTSGPTFFPQVPTYVFDGIYHVVGDLVFPRTHVTLRPGTVFYVDANVKIIAEFTEFEMNHATITAACDTMWDGLYFSTMGAFRMDSSTISNSAGGVKLNVPPDDNYTNIQGLWNGETQISNSTFHNNFYSIQLAGHSVNGPVNYLRGNIFTSDPLTMLAPYDYKSPTDFYYSQAAFRTLNVLIFNVTDNQISNHIYGIFAAEQQGPIDAPDLGMEISGNNFRNCYRAAIIGYNYIPISGYYNRVATILNNEIIVPVDTFTNSQVLASDPVYGINIVNGGFILQDNEIGTDTSNVDGPKVREGIHMTTFIIGNPNTNMDNSAEVKSNIIRRMDTGLKLSMLADSDPDFESNELLDNKIGFNLASNPYSSPKVKLRCNTFDNSELSGNNRAIYVSPGTFLNDLYVHIPGVPNGNAFSGVAQDSSLVYDGIGYADFKYYRYNSTQENIHVTSLFNTPTVNTVAVINTGLTANPGSCPGTPGVNFRLAANSAPLNMEDSVSAIMDSLKFQLGSFRKMKEWQYEILTYHKENKKLDVLFEYCDSLKGCNLEAYNTFMLYLMEKYHAEGKCSKGHECKNKAKIENPQDKEIEARAKYFEYRCRQTCDTTHSHFHLPFMGIDIQDSIDLAYLAQSGTALAEMACIELGMHYPHNKACNWEKIRKDQGDPKHTLDFHMPDCGSECARKREQFIKRGWEKQTGFKADKTGGQLSQNIPNPADNETVIPYLIPVYENTTIQSAYIVIQSVINGSEVKRIELEQAGYNYVTVNLDGLHPGVYTYTLVVNGIKQDVKRMVVVK